jgi:hypothetical protein
MRLALPATNSDTPEYEDPKAAFVSTSKGTSVAFVTHIGQSSAAKRKAAVLDMDAAMNPLLARALKNRVGFSI